MFKMETQPYKETLREEIVNSISMIILYSTSMLYHGIQHSKTKGVFKILDHCAIYILIAGSYTPFALLALHLSEITFECCEVIEVDFREANLSSANFENSDLQASLFAHTNLSNANFMDAINYQIDIRLNTLKKAKFSFPEVVTLLDSLDIEIDSLE